MKLYTNKFPITPEVLCIQPDGSLDREPEIQFPEGKTFKVKCISQDVIVLENKEGIVAVRPEMLQVAFEETDVEV